MKYVAFNNSSVDSSSFNTIITLKLAYLLQSKLGAPSKFDLAHSKKLLTKTPIKEKKLTDKTVESKPRDMQPDSEEAEVKVSASTENDSEREVSKEKAESVECVDHTSPEPPSNEQDSTNKETTNKGAVKETVIEEQAKEVTTNSTEAKPEESEENDLNLSLVEEDSSIKLQEKQSEEVSEEGKETVESKSQSEKEDLHSESQTDTESYSVDVLESTTELSEVSETPSQNESQEKKLQETVKTDTVSYDPAITLKDVQIKLNDCMKESSKCEANDTPIPPRDLSFGKTLRNISGRRSLSRMRHVTLREQRYSPNNSMFVNTSGASLLPDDAEDFKILRYSTGLSDTLSTNGMSERKRKHEEEWSSAKKPKPESENSLLNTSIDQYSQRTTQAHTGFYSGLGVEVPNGQTGPRRE